MAERFTVQVIEFIYEQFDGMSEGDLRQVIDETRKVLDADWPENQLRTAIIELTKQELESRRLLSGTMPSSVS